MKKRITDREFFKKSAEKVAQDLLGKYIFSLKNNEAYQIIETEAYYHDERDRNGKFFCYGVKEDSGEQSRTSATTPLFGTPGTWCIYNGLLLLSVTCCEFPDNVLIRQIKVGGDSLTSDGIAKELGLYQTNTQSNYWNFHGLDSLCEEANLYLMEDQDVPRIEMKTAKRVNINNEKQYNFSIT